MSNEEHTKVCLLTLPSGTKVTCHPASEIFPVVGQEELQELADDIKSHGLMVPVLCHEDGRIIDGRNRLIACDIAGVKPSYAKCDETDDARIAQLVCSLNHHRRHLTKSQLAMAAAKAKPFFTALAKVRKDTGTRLEDRSRSSYPHGEVDAPPQLDGKDNEPIGRAVDQAGELFGVSGAAVQRASKVLEKGTPELQKAVEDSKVSVTAASKIADLPPEVQKEALDDMQSTPKKTKGTYTMEPRIDGIPYDEGVFALEYIEMSEGKFLYIKKKPVDRHLHPNEKRALSHRLTLDRKFGTCFIVACEGDKPKTMFVWMWDDQASSLVNTSPIVLEDGTLNWWREQWRLHTQEIPNEFITKFRQLASIS